MMNQNPIMIESNLLLKNLIDSSHDGITIADENGKIIWYNKAFLRLSGLTPQQIDGFTSYQLVEKGIQEISTVKEAIYHQRVVTRFIKYSSGLECLVTSTPVFDNDHQLISVISNVRDFSELNELRRKLEESTAMNKMYLKKINDLHEKTNESVIYRSKAMEQIINLAQKIADVDTPILILGESGVGKDMLAKYIHNASQRKNKGSFIKINCGAIPENLLESELFGYESGAFTGAGKHGKAGLFEVAHKGTIFLDEIGEMPVSLQVKLLGVLQDMSVQRIGGTRSIPIDVRVIAATNANLETMIKEKRFRADLYYRINVLPIHVPPLRERPEDILVLSLEFLNSFNQKYHLKRTFSSSLLDLFLSYNWPGNIRELKNAVERLVVTSEDKVISEPYLPLNMREENNRQVKIREDRINELIIELDYIEDLHLHPSLKDLVSDYEKKVLVDCLSKYPMKRCADLLKIDMSTLTRKKKRYGL